MKFLETEIGSDRQIRILCNNCEFFYGAFKINTPQLHQIYLDVVNEISNNDRMVKLSIDNLIVETICDKTGCEDVSWILASDLDKFIKLAFESMGLVIQPNDSANEPEVHRSPLNQPPVPANEDVEPSQRPAM